MESSSTTTLAMSAAGSCENGSLVGKPRLKQILTVWFVLSSLLACLSSFQFGFNLSVVNTPQKVVQQYINDSYSSLYDIKIDSSHLNIIWSWTTSIFGASGIIGGLSGGILADKVGRKNAILCNAILGICAAVLMGCSALTSWFYLLIIGRFIAGINCGIHTAVAPMYLTEISPTAIRGAMGTFNQLFITTGILFAEILGLGSVLGTPQHWSIVFAFIAVPTFCQLLLIPFCPESPKYLLSKKGSQHATTALHRLRGGMDISEELKQISIEAQAAADLPKVTVRDFVRHRYLWWPLVISIVMMFSQQLSGVNAVLFYSTYILNKLANLSEEQAAHATIGFGSVLICMTIVSIPLMERLGRRVLQLTGLGGCCVATVLLFISLLILAKTDAQWASYAAVVFILVFLVFFALGPGSIPWFFVFELFEQQSRGIASSFAVGFNWLAFFVSGFFLLLQDSIGAYSFLVFTGLLACFFLFTWWFVPETKNRQISDIVQQFK